MEHRLPEDRYIRVSPTRIGAIDPNAVTSLNTEPNLIPEATLFIELVAGKGRPMVWNSEVNTVDTCQAICSTISFEAILPNNLLPCNKKEETLMSSRLAEQSKEATAYQ